MISPIKLNIPKINIIESTKKYITFSPNSKDSNYSSYRKEQLLINPYKSKKKILYTLLNTNNCFNANKSNISKHYNTLSTINPSSIYLNSTSKVNKAKINKTKNVLLTSLFNLPNISSFNAKKSQEIVKIKNNLDNSKSNNNSFQKNCKNNNDESEVFKLENYMKDKFYEDIDKKMNIKLKYKNFLHDSSIKERIIKMNKIGLFWGGVFEYCNPLLSATKFKFAKKLYQNKVKSMKKVKLIDEYKSKINKEIKPIPVLYTNNLFNKLMRKERIKNMLFKKRNLTGDK
jgi:hypothetical protein